MLQIPQTHAIVLGASIAGLATAASLAPRFSRVTVVERHAAPAGVDSIAPHGRNPHVLLAGGMEAFERLLPGFVGDLREHGAPVCGRDDFRWWSDGWRTRNANEIAPRPLASRGLVETILRRRVTALDNVAICYGVQPTGYLMRDGRVVGVETPEHELHGDLVVDCRGRGPQLARWLTAAGTPEPAVTELEVDLGYLMITLPRKPTDADGKLLLIVQNIAPATRLGLAFAVEGDRWMIVLGGYFGDRPPADRAGYLAFARSLPVDDLARLLELREPITEPLPYVFRSSRRVHVERATLPPGLVVLGDAICSFNPIYGQGMSVAVQQAEALGDLVDRGTLDRAHRVLADIANRAWMLAAGGDLAYPQVAGPRTRMSRLMRRYIAQAFRACSVDGHVVATLTDVTNLLAPPSTLLRPATVARVLLGARRARRTSEKRARVNGVAVGRPVAAE